MKIYLIVALFLGALVVAHSLEEEEKVELPEVPEQAEQSDEEVSDPTEEDTEDESEPSGGTGDDSEENEDEEEEDEEEDPEKRRRRNVLSAVSCLKLKRLGYCRRHLFIRRLCAATCYVPPVCVDRLSRISCIRLRGYRRCNGAVARLYCKKTCRHCGVVPGGGCRNYAVLNQITRRRSRARGNTLLCDQKGFATRWYRFTGAAGVKMPTRAPPKNHCGTHAPGWMVGSYPRLRGQVVTRKVCYHWGNNKCNWHNFIKVKNCGRYFVFFLRPTPVCHLRYCGNA